MSGDELAAELYARQGYLVRSCELPCVIGEIFHLKNCENVDGLMIPVRIIRLSNEDEMSAQLILLDEIDSSGAPRERSQMAFLYRVEAAD